MVEMLDGALPWRPDRGDLREAEDKESAKEMAQQLKSECLQDPRLLTTDVECPGTDISLVLNLPLGESGRKGRSGVRERALQAGWQMLGCAIRDEDDERMMSRTGSESCR